MSEISNARLEQLLGDAIVDCYDAEEELMELLGELVQVVGIDESRSSIRRGVVALVKRGEKTVATSLADLVFVDPDPHSAEWLAVYRYWLGEGR